MCNLWVPDTVYTAATLPSTGFVCKTSFKLASLQKQVAHARSTC